MPPAAVKKPNGFSNHLSLLVETEDFAGPVFFAAKDVRIEFQALARAKARAILVNYAMKGKPLF